MTPPSTQIGAMVRFDKISDVVVATLEHPAKANALTARMLSDLVAAVTDLGPDSPGLVIQGGSDVFSGGIYLEAGRSETPPQAPGLLSELVEAIESCPAPVASIIDGACVGGAVELAVACDLRLGTARARFRVPATDIGIVYRPEGYAALSRRLGMSTVRQLILLGRELDAEAAHAAGILDAIVVDDLLRSAIDALIRLGHVPGTFRDQKRVLRLIAERSTPDSEAMAEIQRIRSAHAERRRAPSPDRPRPETAGR